RGEHARDYWLEVVDLHRDRQQGEGGPVDGQQRRRDGGLGETEARAPVHHPGGIHELWRGVDLDARPAPAHVRQAIAEVAAEPITVDLVEALDDLAPQAGVEWRGVRGRAVGPPRRPARGSVQPLPR